jgi:phosphatidate phosphatase APP1
VIIAEGLYTRAIHYVDSAYIVVSDIDDTILHSHISKAFRKFRTLMFTPVEKRKAVKSIKNLITSYVQRGATAIYLSNSEQNLYPLIYRFLTLNKFPTGPLFLKQIRKLWDVIRYRKLPAPEVHKIKMLNQIIPMFSNKKFILVGDNTQRDLSIYTETAEKYPGVIESVFIRKVVFRSSDDDKIKEFRERLSKAGVNFHYDDEFPEEISKFQD